MTDWLGTGDCGDTPTALLKGGPRTVYRSNTEWIKTPIVSVGEITHGGGGTATSCPPKDTIYIEFPKP